MKTITAIDIGTSAVKLVQMERSKGKIQIVNIGVETYPRQNGSGVDDDTVISCLKGLLAKLALKPKSAIVSIPRAFLTLKRLSNFPRAATDEDIAKLVPFQVEQELPLGLENSIYDYYGLRRSESGASVDLVAARRDFIEGYLKTLKAVGMKVDALYPSTFAIYNLLLQQLEENEENGDKIIGVIDIGACRSELLIMRGKNMVFSTSFKWGGDDLSRLYQNRKTAAEPAQDLSLHLAELDPQFFSWLERLSSEISRAFYAFSSQNLIGNDRRSVDQLWLCGGCTQLKGLDRYLSQLLKVETNIWNPLNLNLFECKSDLKESIELGGIGGNIGISLGLGVASLIGNNDV